MIISYALISLSMHKCVYSLLKNCRSDALNFALLSGANVYHRIYDILRVVENLNSLHNRIEVFRNKKSFKQRNFLERFDACNTQ